MVKKQVVIIQKRKAFLMLAKVVDKNYECYYLADDYSAFIELQNKFRDVTGIESLSGLFDKTFQEMKETLLELLSGLNKEYSSFAWWGGQVASKSTPATPMLLNITYLFCAKKLLLERAANVIFIVDSPALSVCLLEFSRKQGYQVRNYRNRVFEWGETLKRCLYYIAQVGSFFLTAIQNRRAAFKIHKSPLGEKSSVKKRIVIRSWVTQNIFNSNGKFEDRNFGHLPQWLRSQGYGVWILPMFFNLSAKAMNEACARMQSMDQTFLIPEHYLRFSDYIRSLFNGFKVFTRRGEGLKIQDVDVSPLFNEVQMKQGFNVALCILNLSCHMLKRLRQAGVKIDSFYYAFECNAPENQFVLSCREYFPSADIVGFQHTTFFPNQLAYHLAPGEQDYHPLPDKIVCSGPIYRDLHKKARFPEEMLVDGPNLRFESVYPGGTRKADFQVLSGKKNLLLPLTFSYNLAFELFAKVKSALENMDGYAVYIRTHPLLSKKILKDFLDKIAMDDYTFADEGIVQEWLPKMYAMVSTGGTITILEAISFGTPVIRVIPDNTFYYDPFSSSNYPLKPLNTSLEIREQLQLIDKIQRAEEGIFERISQRALQDYFPEPNEENLKVFL